MPIKELSEEYNPLITFVLYPLLAIIIIKYSSVNLYCNFFKWIPAMI